MKKHFLYFSFFIFLLQASGYSQNQADSETHHIAIFVPLYLDSVFDANNIYRYEENFPKFVSAGLEFYEGAQMALDTLRSENAHLDVHIYDTHSKQNSVSQILQSADLQNTELIIGYVNPNESRQLANFALQKHIPFINVNLPNNSNITNNPDLVLLNSTLKTHCESIYRFLQKNYATSSITYLYNKSTMGNDLKYYFTDVEKNTKSVSLHLKYVLLNEPVDQKQLLAHVDSTRQNVIIAGSLNENFSKDLCAQLASLDKTYSMTIIGMPTWDGIDFTQPDYNGLEIYYTTPFYNNPNDTLVKYIQQYFKTKFYSRPSDLVFRGYETVYHFAKLLMLYGNDLSKNIGEKKFKVFDDFDIEPVLLNKQSPTLDYFENKKLYFIKKTDGNITAVY
ncbi:MAG TPA: ABC transporter substrate-binding protein [Puia sp.]|nr:ABC transporter substrate-binding protein [Puia sp.]